MSRAKRFVPLISAAGLALAALFVAAPANAQAPAGPYSVVNRNSLRCIEVNNASLADGAGVLQWSCHRMNHQLWRVNDLGNGYVQLRVEHSDKCLEVNNASQAPAAGVLQWPCHGGTHQQWKRIDRGNGYFQLQARHSTQCLEIDHAYTFNGAGALQWPCHDGLHQQWSLR
ncbi:RICIN domain-containing protein [Lentzea sp. NPDC051213]|uniref:RICIN domain-containing protein n=1 Tax=Lentzea sp. NPDC051213 TaxID=3364126 RepID=UPI00379E273D